MHIKKVLILATLCLMTTLSFGQKSESNSTMQMGTTDDRPDYTKIDLQKAAKEYARSQALPEDEIFIIVEQMPVYPNCETNNQEEAKRCTQESIISYLVENVKYPTALQEDKVAGLVVARFVITSSGSMKAIKILKAAEPEMGAEVTRVLNQLRQKTESKWHPGLQRGNPVSVQMTIPVRFHPTK